MVNRLVTKMCQYGRKARRSKASNHDTTSAGNSDCPFTDVKCQSGGAELLYVLWLLYDLEIKRKRRRERMENGFFEIRWRKTNEIFVPRNASSGRERSEVTRRNWWFQGLQLRRGTPVSGCGLPPKKKNIHPRWDVSTRFRSVLCSRWV